MDISKSTFLLADTFINQYIGKQPNWGPVGYVIYSRTYSRPLYSVKPRHQKLAEKAGLKNKEEYWLTLTRVVEGTYQIQEAHCKSLKLPFSQKKAQQSAQEMFKLMWNFKFLPPGRGLWAMGTEAIEAKGGGVLNNCSFVSTENLKHSFSEPFCFLMDFSMLGVGVGGDTKGAGTISIKKPRITTEPHIVEDTREGWVELTRRVLDSYVGADTLPLNIDYSKVRALGEPIKGFGGVSSGPLPLIELIKSLQDILNPLIGEKITSTAIVDIFNLIGRCVVAGGIRRTAEIMFGEINDDDFFNLKNPEINLEALQHHRWASNNSIFAKIGMDYTKFANSTIKNGEPGYLWLENSQAYSRMKDPKDWRDEKVKGANPCNEQSLESNELCCLVESFPALSESYEEYERTLKYAYLYAKTVTLVPTHNEKTNAITMRNRRIGTSQSGIIQAFNKHGCREMLKWCDDGYAYLRNLDKIYSNWLCVPQSIKITSIKPSGSISLLCGATPGIHYPHSEYYYRVIRFQTGSELIKALARSGYKCIELDQNKEPNTTAVYFPIKEANFLKSKNDVSMWEQLEIAAQYQAYWADNQVSATITFKPEEAKDIKRALELYETRMKGVSFLPLMDHKYEHAPYQTITKEEYEEAIKEIKPLNLVKVENEVVERFCDGETCEIPVKTSKEGD